MRWILMVAVLALAGCAMVDETDRRCADFVVKALPDQPTLALPVAEALSVRLGPPKAPATLADMDALVGEAAEPKSGLNLAGKIVLGLLGALLAAVGVRQSGGTDC